MSDGIRSQIHEYTYAVKTGSKPTSMMSLQTRYVDYAIENAKNNGLRVYIEDVETDDNWKVVWFYKHEHIKQMIIASPSIPKTAYEHWVLGKLFGYSEEAIGEFLKDKGYL